MNRGSLTVISGFSGAGKGTLMKALLEKYGNYVLSVSCTTRQPREGEQDGREYFFISQEEFDRRVRQDEFLEYAGYVNHSYGTPKAYVQDMIEQGKDVLLEIEVQGAAIVREKCPDAILVFVTTPDAQVLYDRLTGRGTETAEVVRNRLCQAAREINEISKYDALIINDELDRAVEQIHQTIQTAKYAPARKKDFLQTFHAELEEINRRLADA